MVSVVAGPGLNIFSTLSTGTTVSPWEDKVASCHLLCFGDLPPPTMITLLTRHYNTIKIH